MQIVKQEIVNAKRGVEFLEQLKGINERLPLEEIDRLIKQLKQYDY